MHSLLTSVLGILFIVVIPAAIASQDAKQKRKAKLKTKQPAPRLKSVRFQKPPSRRLTEAEARHRDVAEAIRQERRYLAKPKIAGAGIGQVTPQSAKPPFSKNITREEAEELRTREASRLSEIRRLAIEGSLQRERDEKANAASVQAAKPDLTAESTEGRQAAQVDLRAAEAAIQSPPGADPPTPLIPAEQHPKMLTAAKPLFPTRITANEADALRTREALRLKEVRRLALEGLLQRERERAAKKLAGPEKEAVLQFLPDDMWEAKLIGAPIVLLHYRDAGGAITDRLVHPQKVRCGPASAGGTEVKAFSGFCMLRKAQRHFLVERIESVADPETGELIKLGVLAVAHIERA